jgi:hypothetical protein
MLRLLLLTFILFSNVDIAFCAVGCDLNEPDRDVARLFPGSTGFITIYVSIDQKGGNKLLGQIEERLGDKFRGLFETVDVPYTIYEILKGNEKIGYIHGVNQKGQYGGIQVFLALDLNGVITGLYFQRLTSKFAKQLRDPEFGKQFIGLSLKDFYGYDIQSNRGTGGSRVDKIKNPEPQAEPDFRAALRAVKKNLILMDEFVFGNRYLVIFTQKGGISK